MPYYHFAIHDGQRITDPQGTILPDESAALRFARQIIGELARGDPDQYAGWFLEVTEEGRRIARLPFDTEDQKKTG